MCILMAFANDAVVHGCHIYKDVWSAGIRRFQVTMLTKVCYCEDYTCHLCTRTLRYNEIPT